MNPYQSKGYPCTPLLSQSPQEETSSDHRAHGHGTAAVMPPSSPLTPVLPASGRAAPRETRMSPEVQRRCLEHTGSFACANSNAHKCASPVYLQIPQATLPRGRGLNHKQISQQPCFTAAEMRAPGRPVSEPRSVLANILLLAAGSTKSPRRPSSGAAPPLSPPDLAAHELKSGAIGIRTLLPQSERHTRQDRSSVWRGLLSPGSTRRRPKWYSEAFVLCCRSGASASLSTKL